MTKKEGKPWPLGAEVKENRVNFAVEAPPEKTCELLLYKKGEKDPELCIDMPRNEETGAVRFLSLEDFPAREYEYSYRVGEEIFVDPYAGKLSGTEKFHEIKTDEEHQVRGVLYVDDYDWEGDKRPCIPMHRVVAYSLHVRGFTKHSSSRVKNKGTFAGLMEKIPYMVELGINQIQCMPVYEFESSSKYVNYWGYGPGYYFAPKAAYAAGDSVTELKDMVKACHRAGIEVVLEMPFEGNTPRIYMEACLRHYMLEYHVDGFILNPDVMPVEGVYSDPMLRGLKLLKHQTGFQNVMRRFLKGDEGMVGDVIYWLRHQAGAEGYYNYIANQNGFTLNDLVSYDAKHNEANGENNQDGPDYNYSWNCGAEGPSRKKAVMALREGQRRNAFFLVLLAQGTPCILAGDEFANTQKGNNNAYCQDNPTGWLDWSRLEREKKLFSFVKALIALRKAHPVLSQEKELLGMDQISCGVPDVSYHGTCAWQTPAEVSSRQLGVYYCGRMAGDEDCFVAYNMHWLEHEFALPALPKGKKWYLAADTKEGILDKEKPLDCQREALLKDRTIAVFLGR